VFDAPAAAAVAVVVDVRTFHTPVVLEAGAVVLVVVAI